MRKWLAAGCAVFLSCAVCFAQQQEEKLTITTYYPSPTGVYNQLQAKRVVIGDVNGDGQINSADVPAIVRPFYVQDNSSAGHTAAFVNRLGYGVAIGSIDTGTWGSIQSNRFVNGGGADNPSTTNLSLNPDGGNVGIGVANPIARLQIGNNVATAPPITDYSDYQILLWNGTPAQPPTASYGLGISSGTLWLNSWMNHQFLRQGAITDMIINNGTVGIGTNNTWNATLHLANNVATLPVDDYAKYQILLWNGTAAQAANSYGIGIASSTMWFNSNRDYRFIRTGAATDLFINGTGVGIGTDTPAAKLHVAGNCTVDGVLSFGCVGITNSTSVGDVYCHCPSGRLILTGGCSTGDADGLRTNWYVNRTTWRCITADASGTATVNCRILCCDLAN